MITVLSTPTYRQLFIAQVIALLGTGMATIALSLLAFELAGEKAGVVSTISGNDTGYSAGQR